MMGQVLQVRNECPRRRWKRWCGKWSLLLLGLVLAGELWCVSTITWPAMGRRSKTAEKKSSSSDYDPYELHLRNLLGEYDDLSYLEDNEDSSEAPAATGHRWLKPSPKRPFGRVARCYVNTSAHFETQHWELLWQDRFHAANNARNLTQVDPEWHVDAEGKHCSGNMFEQVSCNRPHNVWLDQSGALVMRVRAEQHFGNRFTGAAASLRTGFGFDRLEVRASFPLGSHISSTILARQVADQSSGVSSTVTTNKTTQGAEPTKQTQSSTWLELVSHHQRNWFRQGHPYYNYAGYDSTKKDFFTEVSADVDLTAFHLYGYQFNLRKFQAIFDANISTVQTIPYYRYSDQWKPSTYHLQLAIMLGVGGRDFSTPPPEDVRHLNWICPALIIDYIRAYRSISNISGIEPCRFEPDRTDAQLQQIKSRVCVPQSTASIVSNDNEQHSQNVTQVGQLDALRSDSHSEPADHFVPVLLLVALLVALTAFVAGVLSAPLVRNYSHFDLCWRRRTGVVLGQQEDTSAFVGYSRHCTPHDSSLQCD